MTNKLKTEFVGSRVRENTKEFFKGFKLKKSGSVLSLWIDSMPSLYEITVFKVKKVFTLSELRFILSVSNKCKVSPNEDGDFYLFWKNAFKDLEPEKLKAEFDVDKTDLWKKLSGLSFPELFLVEIWANTFCYGDFEGDIEDYIK